MSNNEDKRKQKVNASVDSIEFGSLFLHEQTIMTNMINNRHSKLLSFFLLSVVTLGTDFLIDGRCSTIGGIRLGG
jgi:hypothetical protein